MRDSFHTFELSTGLSEKSVENVHMADLLQAVVDSGRSNISVSVHR